MAIDKAAAMDHSSRISETSIHIVSLIGSVWATIAGMFLFHHKTRKTEFQGVVAFIALLNLLLLYRLLV